MGEISLVLFLNCALAISACLARINKSANGLAEDELEYRGMLLLEVVCVELFGNLSSLISSSMSMDCFGYNFLNDCLWIV